MKHRQGRRRVYWSGFTLIELLVILLVISLMMMILLPALNAAKSQGRQIVCKSNLRQLAVANQNYAEEHTGYSVPGASDIFVGNLHRWYAARKNQDEPFDPAAGPLAAYLTDEGLACPQQVSYLVLEPSRQDYECGNGGYGYNLSYLGSEVWQKGYEDSSYKQSTRLTLVARPGETLAFADTAMFKQVEGSPSLIPYAFAEPRFLIVNQKPDPTWSPYPSIHFRHRKQSNIAWTDGHVDGKQSGGYEGTNEDGTVSSTQNIGWFEPLDNSMFDLK